MLKENKKILIIFSIGIVLIVSMFFVFNKKEEYKELPRVKLKDSINTSGLAIMVESDYKTEKYTKWENKEFPTNGYTLNRIKSGCVDKNGNNIDALTYNEDNKTISIKTKQSVYCYLYYDSLFKGKGTTDEPYEINYIEDLVRLANSVNKDSNTYNSKYFVLKRNLDFNENDSYMKYNDTGFGDINGVSGVEGIKDELTNQEGSGFIPIGNYNKFFEGNIDGKNNKISNLWIYNTIDENQAIGFIGVLYKGSISNLTLSGEIHVEGKTPIGGFVNRIDESIIDNCTNEINITSDTGNHSLGGIAGWTTGDTVIKNSINKGNINNGNNIGGIIAYNREGTLTIENCKNYGKLENNLGDIIGGIVSKADYNAVKTIIKNSINYGEIKVNKTLNSVIYVSGIMGISEKEVEITNSHNEGVINVKGINVLNVGGLIGYLQNIANITNSYNLGEINSSTSGNIISYIGGIVGRIAYSNPNKVSKLENCYNKGIITGGTRTGGIVGLIENDLKLIINKCYNTANLVAQEDTKYTANTNVGGIIATLWNGSTVYVLNSYNTGIIISNPINVLGNLSGLISVIDNNDDINKSTGVIINSYNIGNLKAKNGAYGISRIATKGNSLILNNNYNAGNIEASLKFSVLSSVQNGDINVKNTYYKDVIGIQESNLGDLPEAYPITDANMKNPDGNDQNSLLYKLNQNVTNLNSVGLSSIDESIGTDLDDYTLVNWIIDPTSGYPTLNYNLE